ncbi:MAG TPA: hypothetical protein V6D17_21045 [Candidatus Obscuribacterales bacterium]
MRGFRNNRRRGASIVETAAGLFILIPIVLALVDVAAAVLAQTANDSMCKHAARAAAEATNQTDASTAARTVVQEFPTSPIITAKRLVTDPVQYQANTRVTVVTEVTCTFPVPMFGWSSINFHTDVTEPVVGTL